MVSSENTFVDKPPSAESPIARDLGTDDKIKIQNGFQHAFYKLTVFRACSNKQLVIQDALHGVHYVIEHISVVWCANEPQDFKKLIQLKKTNNDAPTAVSTLCRMTNSKYTWDQWKNHDGGYDSSHVLLIFSFFVPRSPKIWLVRFFKKKCGFTFENESSFAHC